MSLKDLLVHVDASDQGRRRLDAAAALAARHGAHLIGLFVVPELHLSGYIVTQIPDEIEQMHRVAMRTQAEQAEAAFAETLSAAGIGGEWRRVKGVLAPTIALHARYVDLAVIGQHDQGEGSGEPTDHLLLTIGRPSLVIPAEGAFPVIGERILVAWDASRLAARAINDALPLLRRAAKVIVLAVNSPRKGEDLGGLGIGDICQHLVRHGIDVEAQDVQGEDISVGGVLQSCAEEQDVDLIVTGAYGHARWREIVLGGVTRHLLTHMTVPVLMSH
ncbi:MAG: universal stress protein [Rhodospirillales bacterium]